MGKKKNRVDLPLPKTSIKKWLIYLDVEGILEIFLFDGSNVFTLEFPDEPVVSIESGNGVILTNEQIVEVCIEIMKDMNVVFNHDFNVWEAVFKE